MLSGRGIKDLQRNAQFARRDWVIDLLLNVMIVVVSPESDGRPLEANEQQWSMRRVHTLHQGIVKSGNKLPSRLMM